MLEFLDLVPWSSLQQAHGFATHVPAAIRQLCAPDAALRRVAYWKLDNHIVLQSDLYEAAAYVPPFLLELLQEPQCSGQAEALDLLWEIGNGSAPPDIHINVALSMRANFQPEDSIPLGDACRSAVREGIPIYLSIIEKHDLPGRRKALNLLMSFPEASSLIRPRLADLITHEKDPQFREALREAAENLNEPCA